LFSGGLEDCPRRAYVKIYYNERTHQMSSNLKLASLYTDPPPLAETQNEHPAAATAGRRRLRILSYNIQTGISSSKYHHYVTQSWKHVLPCAERIGNLDSIARRLSEYDVVGLQEVDAGSLRSGFINQTKYLAERGHFPYWHDQTNRNLGKFAQHSTGFLSRIKPASITEHKLPGMIPGRGALGVHFGEQNGLIFLILHLALGRRARLRQLGYVAELIAMYKNAVVVGDLNCRAESAEMQWLLRHSDLHEPLEGLHTFPSWRPLHNIDHILVSSALRVERVEVLDHISSDHLPIAMEISLPEHLNLDGQDTSHLHSSPPRTAALRI
jgi:endonuclease/exonuclease/phosphatase family metal-dependent hydrolase